MGLMSRGFWLKQPHSVFWEWETRGRSPAMRNRRSSQWSVDNRTENASHNRSFFGENGWSSWSILLVILVIRKSLNATSLGEEEVCTSFSRFNVSWMPHSAQIKAILMLSASKTHTMAFSSSHARVRWSVLRDCFFLLPRIWPEDDALMRLAFTFIKVETYLTSG